MPKGVYVRTKQIIPPEIRFWDKVMRSGPDDCWLWKKWSRRYPNFWHGSGQIGANRYALQLKLGRTLNRHELACHSCDNPRCVNPNHLFLGTDLDNSRDMVRKGRKERGSRVHGAVLTDDKVIGMREMYATGKYTCHQLGERFGVTASNVFAVVRGVTWRHVGGPITARGLQPWELARTKS